MPEPVSAAVVAVIATGAAVVGTAQGAYTAASGSSGFNVSQSHVVYPKEFPPEMYATAHQTVGWDIIKFTADGLLWSNYLSIAASGYVSATMDPLTGYPSSAHPNVPINRFIVLQFDKSGSSENMSGGLLEVNITPWVGETVIAENGPDNPFIGLRVAGRFDPRGAGDFQFAFKLSINTFGTLMLSDVDWSGSGGDFSVTHAGDHILVYLDQWAH